MNIDGVSAAIANLVKNVEKIKSSEPAVPETVVAPHFYVAEIAINWTGANNTFGGDDDVIALCRVLVSRTSDLSAQALLKTYMRRTGPTSIKAAIEGSPGVRQTLGGLCDDLIVRRFQGHRMYKVNGLDYYGGEWFVQIYGAQDAD